MALVLASIGLSGLVVRLAREPDLGPPLMISPALVSPPPPTTPQPTLGQAAAPSRLPKSPVASSSSPKPSKSPSKSPSKTPSAKPKPPPAASSIQARYSVQRSQRGLRGGAMVTNTGAAAGSWTMTLTFESGVSINRANGATLSSGGNVAVFKGNSLAPDRSAMFGFSGTVRDGTSIRPRSCTINGRSCS